MSVFRRLIVRILPAFVLFIGVSPVAAAAADHQVISEAISFTIPADQCPELPAGVTQTRAAHDGKDHGRHRSRGEGMHAGALRNVDSSDEQPQEQKANRHPQVADVEDHDQGIGKCA